MKNNVDRVIQGDCIKHLKKMEAGCVDLVFADPPFNIGYDYDEYNDKRTCDDYLDWSKQWIAQVKRVLSDRGSFWLSIGDEYAAELKVMATRELGFTCRSWVVWYYTFGVHCKYKFTRSHAHMFYFTKNPKQFTFNTDDIRVPSARQLVYGDKRANSKGRVPDDTWIMPPVSDLHTHSSGFILRPQDVPEGFTADSDTWYFPRVCGTFKERSGFHGCQMPEQLLGRIVKACSNAGDVVLDPFAGSGTTLAVAKKLGRKFLGVELSKEYVTNVCARLSKIKIGDPLDGFENPLTTVPNTRNGTTRTQDGKRVNIFKNITEKIYRNDADTNKGIIEAFQSTRRGYSSDWLLTNKELNEEFITKCTNLSLPGDAFDWNKNLLRLRKTSLLSNLTSKRSPKLDKDKLLDCEFASEIAYGKFNKMFGMSLDDILCNPEIANKFDELASTISPGYPSQYYRWAAITLRKKASDSRRFAIKHQDEMKRAGVRNIGSVSCLSVDDIPARRSVYLLDSPLSINGKTCTLFVGETLDLKQWIIKRIETGMFDSNLFSDFGGTNILFQYANRKINSAEMLNAYRSYFATKHKAFWNHSDLILPAA